MDDNQRPGQGRVPQAIDFAPRGATPTGRTPSVEPNPSALPSTPSTPRRTGLVPGWTGAATPPMPDAKCGYVPADRPITLAEATDYGKDVLTKSASIADKITGIARAGDIDDLGKSLGSLLVTAKQYDPATLKKGGGFLGMFKVKAQELKNHFSTVDQQVDKLLSEADARISLFHRRIGDIDLLYQENEARYHDLGALADALEARVDWMDANPPAAVTTDSFSAMKLSEWKDAAAYARKRVDNMRRGQALCQLNAPMLKMMQSNAGALVLKFGEIKSDTIPALKQAFALYILNLEMEKGADFATAIDDTTNNVLKANAAKLGITTVKVQTALARSSIDLSTLQAVHDSTVKAIDDAQRIREEMKTRLQAESPQIAALSQQLALRLAA